MLYRLNGLREKEKVAKMKQFRIIGVAVLAVAALGAVVASGAQAESAPFFSIGGSRLVAGKTHNFEARGIKPFALVTPASSTAIECSGLTVEKGVLLGSEAGTRGKTDQVNHFTGCELTEGNGAPSCHLAETEGGEGTSTTLTTTPLHGELVENVEGSKAGKKLEELYTPASGSIFMPIFFGGQCTVKAWPVWGSTAAEVVTDPGEASIELPGPTPEATSFITRFPATPITSVWLVSGGVGKRVSVETVWFFSSPAELFGTALVSLANSKFERENTKWSPLP
jgi:hypothetical protein